MLTKEMLRAKVRKGKLYPQFLDFKDESLGQSLEELIECLSNCKGKGIGAVKQELHEGFESIGPAFVGLIKLLLDKCELTDEGDAILKERWEAFQQSNILRLECENYEEFQAKIAEVSKRSFESYSETLYSDLPEFKKIKSIPKISKTNLIARYNAAQVQGHLLKSKAIELRLEGLNIAEKRRLMRIIKFHGLIAEFEDVGKNALSIKINGPLSIFNSGALYGAKISNIFPRILEFPNWELSTEVEHKKKQVELGLKSCQELKSYLPKGSGYVPLELENFKKAVNKADSNHSVEIATKVINLGKQNYCVPDFEVIENTTESLFYIEVFHKWHLGQLTKRLEDQKAVLKNKLLLAIPRVLAKKTDVDALIKRSSEIKDNLIFYQDFPTPSALEKVLKKHRQEV